MKFFGKSKDSGQKKNVLFVCVENAGRSQMAEGFFRKYSPEGYEPLSAGTRPVSGINPCNRGDERSWYRYQQSKIKNIN